MLKKSVLIKFYFLKRKKYSVKPVSQIFFFSLAWFQSDDDTFLAAMTAKIKEMI